MLKLILHQVPDARTGTGATSTRIIAAVRTGREAPASSRCATASASDTLHHGARTMLLERNRRAMAESHPRDRLRGRDLVLRGLCLRRRAWAWGRTRSPARCAVKATRLVFDFEGTDPQSEGSINFYLSEAMFKMFVGVYMIMVFDPQILFNDGFYDLVEVQHSGGDTAEADQAGGRSPAGRTALGRIFDVIGGHAGSAGAGLPHRGRLLRQPAPDVLRLFEQEGRVVSSSTRSASAAFPASRLRRRARRPLAVALVHQCPQRVPGEPTSRSAWRSTRPSSDSAAGAGYFRGGNGITAWATASLEPGEVSIHDDRWLTYPYGRQRRRARRARHARILRHASTAPRKSCPPSATTSR